MLQFIFAKCSYLKIPTTCWFALIYSKTWRHQKIYQTHFKGIDVRLPKIEKRNIFIPRARLYYSLVSISDGVCRGIRSYYKWQQTIRKHTQTERKV
jgi:hypothetical protein